MGSGKDHIYESFEEQERIKRRAALRAKLKSEFIKHETNPHVHGQGGYLFDPAVQRFMSMNATIYERFRPTVKNSLMYFGTLGLIAGFAALLEWDRREFDGKCRRGEISYKDRDYKFK